MGLEFVEHEVREILFGKKALYQDGRLILSREELQAACLKGIMGYRLEFELARPGERKRLIHLTDSVKPAFKEGGAAFPGWTEGENHCGEGVTHFLNGVCLTQSFSYPGIQEGILDMSGAGARYSVLSSRLHVVMLVSMEDSGRDKRRIAEDLVRMNLQGAAYLGELAAREPRELRGTRESGETRESLEPREAGLLPAGYVYFIQSQGPLRNTFLYGQDCVHMEPGYLGANEILDGALVSGNYIIACQKNPTCLHQDNPVILEALARNGKEIAFRGVIVSTESSSLEEKQKNAAQIASLAKERGMKAVIITQEGGGHADVDLMLAHDACQAQGIQAVLMANEIAGPEGNLPPLVSYAKEADAIVTTGNNDEVVELEPVEQVIGAGATVVAGVDAAGPIRTSLGLLYTATNQLGSGKMTTRAY